MPHLCLYVTGHGYGHASRAQAVAETLLDDPRWSVELRTAAPREVFDWLLGDRCCLSAVHLDPGVVQSHSFHHDLEKTVAAWRALLDRREALIDAEARHLDETRADVVLSDVSPLACAAARRAGRPSLVMGNFTWDWILEAYRDADPRFDAIVADVRHLYAEADLYLRLPMSPPTDLFRAQRDLPLVARRAHRSRAEVRARLAAPADEVLVLLSFGGFGIDRLELEGVRRLPNVRCVWDRGPSRPPVLLSTEGSDLRYPELLRAVDVVLTKPGFSIIAESIAQRMALAYAPRHGFRENALLVDYLERTWPASRAISVESLADGSWVEPAVELARSGAPRPEIPVDGAANVVEIVREWAGR